MTALRDRLDPAAVRGTGYSTARGRPFEAYVQSVPDETAYARTAVDATHPRR